MLSLIWPACVAPEGEGRCRLFSTSRIRWSRAPQIPCQARLTVQVTNLLEACDGDQMLSLPLRAGYSHPLKPYANCNYRL
jgi:hypothetical protein